MDKDGPSRYDGLYAFTELRRRESSVKRLYPYLVIWAGTALSALTVHLFLLPNQLASGGLGGLLLILHYLWGTPIGTTYFVLNIPIVYALFRVHGWEGLARTVWGIISFSVMMELCAPLSVYAPTTNPLLAAIYSGVLIGLGLGVTLMVGGSTGGASTIAHVVKHYTGVDPSRFLFISDLLILLFAALALNMDAILYGLLTTYITSRAITAVQEGLTTSRCLMIISEHPAEVSAAILTDVKRGITQLDGTGAYSGQPRPVLMCVVAESEVIKVKRIVLQTDPAAFLLITDAREVNGRGFTLETEERPLPYWRGI